MSSITLSITEARQNFLNLVREAKDVLERVIITKNGKPQAVLMSYEEYESWLETLDIMKDPELMQDIAEAKADIKAGRLYTHEEIFGSMDKKRKTIKKK